MMQLFKKENNALNLEVYKLGKLFELKIKDKIASMQCVMINKCLIKIFKMYIMMIF